MEITEFSAAARSGNVALLYDETATHHAGRLAIEMDGRRFAHADLRDRSARVAGGLIDLGLEPDDRIAIYLPNRPEYVVAALAALKAGLPFTPLNPQFRAGEVATRLDDGDAAAVVTGPSLRDTLADAVAESGVDPLVVSVGDGERDGDRDSDHAGDRDGSRDGGDVRFADLDGPPTVVERGDDDVAMQPYTSGTTGEPKGVLLTHRNLRAQSFVGFERTAIPAEEERFLSVLPLAHIAGFVNRTWQPLVRGASVHLRDPGAWDPEEAMETIERERITKFGAVTAMYIDLIEHERFGEYDLSSLREAMEGGTSMAPAVQRRFEEVAGVDLFEAYGLTETGGGTHVGFGTTFGPRHGTVGQPLRATDCKIVDDAGEEVPTGETGELLVRGPHVMAGYHDRPEATAEAFTENGYLRTGDVARRDADNYYEIVGRESDVIVTAGYNVYPSEVEDALHRHDGVVDAAVVGVPDHRRGETVKAYVIARPDRRPSAEELRAFCLDELAPYKHPREIEFVDALPRTGSGKIQRFRIRQEADG